MCYTSHTQKRSDKKSSFPAALMGNTNVLCSSSGEASGETQKEKESLQGGSLKTAHKHLVAHRLDPLERKENDSPLIFF